MGQDLEQIIYVSWEETEKGWGTRPDGYSLHLNEDDFKNYEKEYWSQMPDAPPSEYSRPVGSLTVVNVSKRIYNEIKKTEYGMRRYDEHNLIRNKELVFVTKRSGWVPL